MKDYVFGISSVSPLLRDMDQKFGIADANIRIPSGSAEDCNNIISLEIRMSYNANQSMAEIRRMIYEEAKSTLRRAVELLEKHDVETIYDVAVDDI